MTFYGGPHQSGCKCPGCCRARVVLGLKLGEVRELTPADLTSVVTHFDPPSIACPRCSPDSTESLAKWAEYVELPQE